MKTSTRSNLFPIVWHGFLFIFYLFLRLMISIQYGAVFRNHVNNSKYTINIVTLFRRPASTPAINSPYLYLDIIYHCNRWTQPYTLTTFVPSQSR